MHGDILLNLLGCLRASESSGPEVVSTCEGDAGESALYPK